MTDTQEKRDSLLQEPAIAAVLQIIDDGLDSPSAYVEPALFRNRRAVKIARYRGYPTIAPLNQHWPGGLNEDCRLIALDISLCGGLNSSTAINQKRTGSQMSGRRTVLLNDEQLYTKLKVKAAVADIIKDTAD